jgi:GNAT superfamily N-acetyltransferase
MTAVVQLVKQLESRPILPSVPGILVRNYAGPQDIGPWLALRHRAFARLKVGVRHWDRDDFEQELLSKPWWSPERLWLAELFSGESAGALVGTVALAERSLGKPAVHWLAVDPRYRRRGIARLLLAHLESACWDAGQRRIWLETHSAWQEAGALYRRLGYRPVLSDRFTADD